MYRACVWGLLLSLAACREKEPAEGAIRVLVKYGTYVPACVRVLARDGQGHEARTDIPREKFQDVDAKEVRVAVFRKPEWGQELMLEVSSYQEISIEGCAGDRVETRSSNGPVEVPRGEFASFEAVLQAQDKDGDTYIALEGLANADCDDERDDVYPGAAEKCSVRVDFDCNGFQGCLDSKCLSKSCDDGDPCTTEDTCEPDARCLGKSKVCNSPPTVCHEAAGTCNTANGQCVYASKPVATACDDGKDCTVIDQCNASGVCEGQETPCTPSSSCRRITGGCTALNNCMEELDPSKVNTECTRGGHQKGTCRFPDGACSSFPYVPSHFDPDAIPEAKIAASLTITCDVTFDSTPGLMKPWSPEGCVSSPPEEFKVSQGSQAPEVVVLPVRGVRLDGTWTLAGTRPVILAVYGDATLTKDILANGHLSGTAMIPGAGGNQFCGSRQGGAGGDLGPGGGGGGAGGGTAGEPGGRGYYNGEGGAQGARLEPSGLLLGGCAGGNGGSSYGGKGGAGGGAIQISVAGTLSAGAWVTASGGGGGGGEKADYQAGGGGGGGSGGQVLLEASRLVLSSGVRLTSNGGGAGGGGENANPGAKGEDGPRSSDVQANGGAGGGSFGGNGGKGGARARPPVQGSSGGGLILEGGAGGGGGGAVGSVRLRSMQPCEIDSDSVISPETDRQCPL
ncbi:uncharacterized protein STAUR_6619 [Stigmatella aurantiaca DW4/3-1]|uniref:Lipoprotein n=1 Tax=Stigmatella aurantiaca (strain DW4/3-1) TaxID=378806 RepID=Q09C34_STIAD|nr:uncharacterized protein STAUR_6619 [Stigmatella aurantiaca DW4/3-1]EAU69240.1 hypothetical protein STIAU_8003 [Stigmatella aurantiaca DW4/3-1]